ncbi:hypothetical protein ACFLIM_34460 [Nonomuraea sp. M3C6]|uniref:Extracellular repeat, HAF family n=1 Tax=Nonomuraea marmarensis TaxID=3351344 RepID=A0ABW7ALP3_9ACTN
MTRSLLLVAAFLAVLLAATPATAAIDTPVPGFLLDRGRYTTIDAPGGARSQVLAIGVNAQGAIVGDFDDSSGRHHGFLLRKGKFTRIDFPGAKGSTAGKINNSGDVVGAYSLTDPYPGSGNAELRGYLLRGGKFTRIDFPGADQTQPLGLNNLGQVVGTYVLGGEDRSFLWENGKYRDIKLPDFPGAVGAAITGIDDFGRYIGVVVTGPNRGYGLLLDRGKVTTYKSPGDVLTFPSGINDLGQVVGTTYRDGTQATARGFLLAKGVKGPFTRIEFPRAPASVAFGINNRGQIVGAYAKSLMPDMPMPMG